MQVKPTLLAMVAGVALSVTMNAAAASSNDTEASNQAPKAPITVEADNLSIDDSTGAFSGQGNVIVKQNDSTITADLVEGNSHKFEVWVNDTAHYTGLDAAIDGHKLFYNYQTNTGTMDTAKGKVGHQHVFGEQIELYPNKDVIHNGYMTRCPAKVPDYRISADWIEIWPGEYFVAHNAKFWIKNTVIYSMSAYKGSLEKGAKDAFPAVGYDSDGFFITQHLETPVSEKNHISAFLDIAYHSDLGFKPVYGFKKDEAGYSLTLLQGEFKDDDDYWIKKRPELQWSLHPRRLGSLPISYTVSAAIGNWDDNTKSSWHQEYKAYFTRDPIALTTKTTLHVGTGFAHVRESYDDSKRNVVKFNARINHEWAPKFTTWAGYNYTRDHAGLFDYEEADAGREVYVGASYRFDRMNAVSVNQVYSLDTHQTTDLDYTWKRSLHCWDLDLTYRAKRHEVNWKIKLAEF